MNVFAKWNLCVKIFMYSHKLTNLGQLSAWLVWTAEGPSINKSISRISASLGNILYSVQELLLTMRTPSLIKSILFHSNIFKCLIKKLDCIKMFFLPVNNEPCYSQHSCQPSPTHNPTGYKQCSHINSLQSKNYTNVEIHWFNNFLKLQIKMKRHSSN